jgi:hypothetical protein
LLGICRCDRYGREAETFAAVLLSVLLIDFALDADDAHDTDAGRRR